MRHLIVLAGLILCSQAQADPLQAAGQPRKPIDYSRSHALSGHAPTATSAARGAPAGWSSIPGGAAQDIPRGTDGAPSSGDQVDAWLALQQNAGSWLAPADGGTAAVAPAGAGSPASRLANRFATLVVDAISHIGVPYKYGGNSVEAGGFDCSGFVKAVYHEALGAILPRRSEEQAAATSKIDRGELQPGDLVFFKTTRRAFSHVGIYVGADKFVHAPRTGARIRMEDMTSAYWSKRFNGARRVEVAEGAAPVAQAPAGYGAY